VHALDVDDVVSQRLAVQRLSSAPLADPVDVVRLLTCVQAQDAPLARFSLGLRTGLDDARIRAALDSGAIVRTHVLRPTWHFVAAEDLRWILALTTPKVVSGMAARHRQLEITPEVVTASERVLSDALARRTALTRPELGTRFAAAGLPSGNEQVGHLLGLAELHGLICSGPLRGAAHTYLLVDDVAPPAAPLDRADAIRELTRRFFAGHGPASERDLNRWTKLTLTEIRSALTDLAGELESTEVEGVQLWSGSDAPPARAAAPRAYFVPVFDELYLSYPKLNLPRLAGHPRGDGPHFFAEHGMGIVICDRLDVGWWKRKEVGPDRLELDLHLSPELDAAQCAAIELAAEQLAKFTGRTVTNGVRPHL
jgi:hypothetical protein